VELIGLFLVGAALLVIAGVAKVVRPDDTARAIGGQLPSGRVSRWAGPLVRVGAGVEAALGLVALAFPRPLPATMVAVSYLAFAVFVTAIRIRGGVLATCGCFGRGDTPASWLHVALDLVFAATALTVALRTTSGATIGSVLSHQPVAGLPLLLVSGAGVMLAYLALSVLPVLDATSRLARNWTIRR
jgi:hypothetical protein